MSLRVQKSRRAFLGGAGTIVSLPFLESLVPRQARAAAPAKRLLFYYVPCGIHMQAWTPTTAGPDFALTPILQSLEPVRSHLTVISGLANMLARPDGAGDHASGTGAFLTCAHPKKTPGVDIQNGISVDQVAANRIGTATVFPSLQLGMESGSAAGDCDSGYSCAYARSISWSGPATPLPKLTNPQMIFDRLFQGTDAAQTLADRTRRKRRRTSVLDQARDDAQRLAMRMGRTDKKKLDEYLTGVRELETRVRNMPVEVAPTGGACKPEARPASGLTVPLQLKAMADLMVMAFACDLTRVTTFMLGNAGSGRAFPFLNITGGHHQLSHHQMKPENLTALQAIGTWEIEQFAYLLTRMKAVDEGNGTNLLDNSSVFFSSEITDGDRHNHDNMPVLLAGKGGGAWKGGTHLNLPLAQKVPLANLYLAMLATVGAMPQKFGDSTGVLSGI